MSDTYVPESSFASLVLTLSSSAWVGLGKIADPVSGELRKDLAGAKLTIDMLIMLRDKTKGNLSDDEQKLLAAVLNDLQANYAEEVFEEKKTKEDKTGETPPPPSEGDKAPEEEDEGGEAGKDTSGETSGETA